MIKSKIFAVSVCLGLGIALSIAARYFFGESQCILNGCPDLVKAIQTYTIAIVSIMAGFVAITTSAKDSYWMRSFQAEGLMKEYIFFYCYTIVTLLVCYLVSLLAYTRPGALLLTIPFVIVATLQVILVMWGAYSIVHKSKENGTDN